LGPSAAPAVPALIHIYEGDRDPWVRGCAALSLGAIGPEARDACPAVVRGMISQTTNGILTMETIWALRSLKPAPELAVPALVKCLADPYSGVKQAAAEALVALGTNAASAVPVLVAMFQSSESGPVRDPALKAAVAAALNAIDPETAAREGVPKN